MMSLIEELYQIVAEKWSLSIGLLDSDEYFEYLKSARCCDEQEQQWRQQLTGDELTQWSRYLANVGQLRDTECRLCFARGLIAGLSLGSLTIRE